MTRVCGNEFRDPSPGELATVPKELQGNGFSLQPRAVKVYIPSGAPLILFDVIAAAGNKIGIASLILECDVNKVSHVGHVCSTLSEAAFQSSLLQSIAELLVRQAHEHNIATVRIAVPREDSRSIHVCMAMAPDRQGDLENESRYFEYSRTL